jgi:hypothetical protein|tara:strand:- start:3774 stop:4166 length:393 start_codon:yes stop_codon:yes gene_type:complete
MKPEEVFFLSNGRVAFEQAWIVLKQNNDENARWDGKNQWHSIPCSICGAQTNDPCTEIDESDIPLIQTKLRGMIPDPFGSMTSDVDAQDGNMHKVHGSRMVTASSQPNWFHEDPNRRYTPEMQEEDWEDE